MKRRTFQVDEPGPLGESVAEALEEPLEVAKRRVRQGTVFLEGKRNKQPEHPVTAGALVSVVLESSGRPESAPRAVPSVTVLFEDGALLVVDKPPFLAAQPTPDGGPNLLDWASARLGYDAGLVHRLDKETSGVTVFGKTSEATSRLAAAFREGRARKQYLALTGPGFPADGRIDTPLQKDPSRPGRWRALQTGNGVSAVTRFVRLTSGERCLVRLFPETGRTHQLRVHLASLGFPIIGDRLYGGPAGPRCLLHAHRLEIDGQSFEAPIPADFEVEPNALPG